jgi:hypothetical protein
MALMRTQTIVLALSLLAAAPALSLLAAAPAMAQFANAERAALAEPFRGVTSDGTVVAGLFGIESTGVSTAPVKAAADAFLAGLSAQQRRAATFAVQDDEWRKWANVHRYVRQGVGFNEMDQRQRNLAYGLLQASLSAKGLKLTRDIMRLNETLAELTQRPEEYGEFLYWITVMGTPSATEPWGWQLDGHHLVINYFVLGDQVVMTPTFMGSEPVFAASGKYQGTRILEAHRDRGLALVNSLNATQRQAAILDPAKSSNRNQAELFRDNVVIPYAGVRASALDARQKGLLMELIAEYVENMREGHARVKMEEVRKHLDATYFAWVGANARDSAFYYRVHSPVILIELDHQTPVALPGERVPSRDHIHTVVRTPNGNDYGKDLLRQHLELHKDDHAHGHDHDH